MSASILTDSCKSKHQVMSSPISFQHPFGRAPSLGQIQIRNYDLPHLYHAQPGLFKMCHDELATALLSIGLALSSS